MTQVTPPGPADRASPGPDEAQTVASRETIGGEVDAPTTIGVMVGRYVVLEEVGRGGMGRVLRAYDPKLQREVALKELRRDRLDAEGTRRLVAEARAMAKLSHAHVVAVYDVESTSDGALVLVMEYVAGPTLEQWLRDASPPWNEVVQCFVQAGRGLEAAHAAGLLHRDFKPANVLVGADGVIKVTDFGLAKGTADTGDEPAGHAGTTRHSGDELTAAGVVLGTPRYMAPEQHRGAALTPAADQYALCVSLWKALCGTAPFAGKQMLADKLRGPPPWPTPRVPRPIGEAIRRGLAPRPEDRWPSVTALLDALTSSPARRRRRLATAIAGGAVAAAAIVAWQGWASGPSRRCSGAQAQLGGVWDDARRAEVETALLATALSYAPGVWERTARELDGYATAWATMHTEACEATTVRGEQSAAALDLRMACLHRAKSQLGAVVDVLADADDDVLRRAHRVTDGLRPLARCADVEALAADVEPPPPEHAAAVDEVRRLLAEASATDKAGRYAQAQQRIVEATELARAFDYGPLQTEIAVIEGLVLSHLGDAERADARGREALELAGRWRQWDAMAHAATQLLLVVGDERRQPEVALRYVDLALGLVEGDPLREAAARHALAAVLLAKADYDGAEREIREALALREQALGVDDAGALPTVDLFAAVLFRQGKLEQAEAEHRRALALGERALGPEHPDLAFALGNLANVLGARGRLGEAEEATRRALHIWEQALGTDHVDVARMHSNLAQLLNERGKYAQAEAEARRSLQSLEAAHGGEHPDLAYPRNSLANALAGQGRHAEAEAEYRKALAQFEQLLGPDHLETSRLRTNLAGALLAQGHGPDAVAAAERAWARRQRDDTPPNEQARTAFVLARALWLTDDDVATRTRARALAELALASHARAEVADVAAMAKVRDWLASPGAG